MIPKIIHYCWLSNDPIPDLLQKCRESWKTVLTDYRFILWNFDRFDKHSSIWVEQAFDRKKYAFAADYIRLFAVYNYGGIYLDMDVEVLKSFDEFLYLKTMLCWQKGAKGVEIAAWGAEKGCKWVGDCLKYYENKPFLENGKCNILPQPIVVENILNELGYKLIDVDNICNARVIESETVIPIFRCDFFSPMSYKNRKLEITNNTVSIHRFVGAWVEKPRYEIYERNFWKLLHLPHLNILNKIIWRFRNGYKFFLSAIHPKNNQA